MMVGTIYVIEEMLWFETVDMGTPDAGVGMDAGARDLEY